MIGNYFARGTVARYCDELVCLCVCLSLPIFLCLLPMAVDRSSSGRVTKSQEEEAIFCVKPVLLDRVGKCIFQGR